MKHLLIVAPFLVVFACGSSQPHEIIEPSNVDFFKIIDTMTVRYGESGGPTLRVQDQNFIYERGDLNLRVETSVLENGNQTFSNSSVALSSEFYNRLNSWLDLVIRSKLEGVYHGDSGAGGSDFPVVEFKFFTQPRVFTVVVDTSVPASLPPPLNDLYRAFLFRSF